MSVAGDLWKEIDLQDQEYRPTPAELEQYLADLCAEHADAGVIAPARDDRGEIVYRRGLIVWVVTPYGRELLELERALED